MRKKKTQAELPELTPFELEIMQVVWERGNATASEVMEGLKRELADTTIHTVLSNLRKKGYVEPIPTIERAQRFAPCVEREQVATRSLRRVLSEFFQGSPQRLMAHLLNEEKVDEGELKEIRTLLEQSKKAMGKSKEKGK